MIKAVLFDFDGVLLESADLKTKAFKTLFSQWPDKTDAMVSYHLKNMGISRFVKFKYFYEELLGEPYTDEKGEALSRKFSDIVLDEIKKAPLVNGAREFLEEHYRKILLFVASGTPQEELLSIVSCKEIKKYFNEIFGSPASKKEIIENVRHAYNLEKHEMIFVGDAESDMNASLETNIYFVARATEENHELVRRSPHVIKDLTRLDGTIKKIEGCSA